MIGETFETSSVAFASFDDVGEASVELKAGNNAAIGNIFGKTLATLKFLLGIFRVKNDSADVFFEVGSSDEHLAVGATLRFAARNAGFDEASGKLLIGLVHSKEAFFRSHDKFCGVLKIGTFFFFGFGERLKLAGRKRAGDSSLLGINTSPEHGVCSGAAY